MKTFTISFDGLKNIQKAEKFIGDLCYRAKFSDDGKFIGQLEVVIPFGEVGFLANRKKEGLVDFSFISQNKIEEAIKFLESIGISGIVHIDSDEDENYKGCFFRIGKYAFDYDINIDGEEIKGRCYFPTIEIAIKKIAKMYNVRAEDIKIWNAQKSIEEWRRKNSWRRECYDVKW